MSLRNGGVRAVKIRMCKVGTDNASLDIYSGQIKPPTATWILSIGVWHLGATRDAALKFPFGQTGSISLMADPDLPNTSRNTLSNLKTVSNKMSEEIKDSKTTDGISDADMKSLARTLLPILREYLLSDEGRKDYDEWKKKQVNRKLNKKEESR